MGISRKKFVIIFLISAFVFQFISNSVLGPEVRLFPQNGDFFMGADSPIAWKKTMAAIVYPIKVVLMGPLASFFKGPDGAPPVLLVGFGLYWTIMALMLHFVLSKIFVGKKA